MDLYAVAFTDWLACACGGADERAARAVRASGTDLLADVAFAGTAGHVLDFDDTLSDGIAHVSATCAPAALVLAAELGLSLKAALDAYASGFEAMAAVAAASHPALYDAELKDARGLVVTDHIYRSYPTLPEGELAKVRASVVSAAALAEVAGDLRLGEALLLGKGEASSGGREKPSILADALEAVLGAVYLAGGWEAAERLVLGTSRSYPGTWSRTRDPTTRSVSSPMSEWGERCGDTEKDDPRNRRRRPRPGRRGSDSATSSTGRRPMSLARAPAWVW